MSKVSKKSYQALLKYIESDMDNLKEQFKNASISETEILNKLKIIRDKKHEIEGAMKALNTLKFNIEEDINGN